MKVGCNVKYMIPQTNVIQTGIISDIIHADYGCIIYEIIPREIYANKDGKNLVKVFRTQKELIDYNSKT